MKNVYLLICLFFYVGVAYGQQKSGFGLSIKSGNYTLPSRITTTSKSIFQTTKYEPGFCISGGMYYNWQLNKRLSLNAELLFQRSIFMVKIDRTLRYTGDNEQYNSDGAIGYQVAESIVSLPVKLQYALGSKRRTGISAGYGIARVLNFTLKENSSFYYLANPQNVSTDASLRFRNRDKDFRFEFPIFAGLSHQISDKTTLGIEYTYQRRRLVKANFGFDDSCECCDCGYGFEQVPAIQNIAVLMQYKLLE